MASLFTVTTLLISVPVAEMMFVYIATLYGGGSITLTATPMLWALAFIAEFLIGGVTGIFLGAAGDIYFHDTYFVIARTFTTRSSPSPSSRPSRPSVPIGSPKMFGKMMDERLGKIHFWITIILGERHLHPAVLHRAAATTGVFTTMATSRAGPAGPPEPVHPGHHVAVGADLRFRSSSSGTTSSESLRSGPG